MKKNYILSLSILIAGALIAGAVVWINTGEDGSASVLKDGKEYTMVQTGDPTTITVLTDPNCTECHINDLFAFVTKNIAPQIAIREVDVASEEGKDLVSKYDLRYIPILFFDKELEKHNNFMHLTHHVVSALGNGTYFLDLEKTGQPIGRYLGIDYYNANDPKAPRLEIEPKEYDFGDVSQATGVTQTTLPIKNTGNSPLTITNMITSCMCTTAQLEINGEKSPIFGMPGHGEKPVWSGSIEPGGEGKLTIFYDPNAHKELRGAVTRVITISTNDPDNAQSDIKIRLNQIP